MNQVSTELEVKQVREGKLEKKTLKNPSPLKLHTEFLMMIHST